MVFESIVGSNYYAPPVIVKLSRAHASTAYQRYLNIVVAFLYWCSNLVLQVGSGWFKNIAPKRVSHERRLQYILECRMLGIILTAMNSRRRWHSQFCFEVLGLALAAKTCPNQPQAFQMVNNSQAFP